MTGKTQFKRLTEAMEIIGDNNVEWMDVHCGWRHHISDMCARQSQNGPEWSEKQIFTGKN